MKIDNPKVTGRLTLIDQGTSELSGSFSGSFQGSFIGDGTQLSGVTSYTDSDTLDYINSLGVISGSGQIDHDQTLNFVADEHIDHASIEINAGNGLTGGGSITGSLTLTVGQGDGISVGNSEISVDNTVVRTSGSQEISGVKTFTSNNIFQGNQSFDNISVSGTGSFAYIQQITGSAKIIGDAYIILNANTPAERYAGIKVFDSGSTDTGSLEYDAITNHWFYQSTNEGYASILLAGPTGSRESLVEPTTNTILKSLESHHVGDSNIIDDGSTVTINSKTVLGNNTTISHSVSGSLLISGSVGINTSTLTETLSINGGLTATGDGTFNTSDDRLKNILGTIENPLDKVEELTGFYYEYNELAKSKGFANNGRRAGVSAQKVEKVLPEAVTIAPFDRNENGDSSSGENYLTVRYERLVPLLVESIKELRKEIQSLKQKYGE